jgi:intracellular sulfur oxidation DsrE/DsrF family protein
MRQLFATRLSDLRACRCQFQAEATVDESSNANFIEEKLMKFVPKSLSILPVTVAALLFANLASAADPNANPNPQPCPVEPYGALSMDQEFGTGAQDITLCNRVRHGAKVVVSVGHPFLIGPTGQPNRSSARYFSNLDHMIANYEKVHGMTIGKDVEVAVVLLESGGALAATSHAIFNPVAGGPAVANPFIALVQQAMAAGVKVYLCQTAARSLGINMSNMIPGIQMVPGGHISVADFQLQGYALINLL